MKNNLILFFLLFSLSCFGQAIPLNPKFVRAIHLVESGGKLGEIKGDYNKKLNKYLALGPLQIQEPYFRDALDWDNKINNGNLGLNKFNYYSCTNLEYSIKVMAAYLNRYSKNEIKKSNFEALAKTHNGGCGWKTKTGKAKENLENYWFKVKRELDRMK